MRPYFGGTALPLLWSYSQKLVTGTKQRYSARRYGFQYWLFVLRTFVTRSGPLVRGPGEAPAHHQQFPPAVAWPDHHHRGHLVGDYSGDHRQVA